MIVLNSPQPAGVPGPPRTTRSDQYVLLRQLLGSARRLVPLARRGPSVHSPPSAEYCYSVWLRHMALASQFGPHDLPRRHVIELGPGGSLGVGLAALLHGAETYRALDAAPFARMDLHRNMLQELTQLYRRRAPVPAHEQFPRLKPPLFDYRYSCATGPVDLSPEGVGAIGDALSRLENAGGQGSPDAPRLEYSTDRRRFDEATGAGQVDLVICQAVMQYLPDLDEAYAAQYRWLRPGGWVSHQVDLSAHETAASWNGHLAIPEPLWRILKATRPILINRETYSGHLAAMRRAGFEVLVVMRSIDSEGLPGQRLARPFRQLGDEDLQVRGAWFMARKV